MSDCENALFRDYMIHKYSMHHQYCTCICKYSNTIIGLNFNDKLGDIITDRINREQADDDDGWYW